MTKRKPEDELDKGLSESMMLGPFPFEYVKPRLRDRIPLAFWWWLFGFITGAMAVLVVIEMFTSIDLGFVPNG